VHENHNHTARAAACILRFLGCHVARRHFAFFSRFDQTRSSTPRRQSVSTTIIAHDYHTITLSQPTFITAVYVDLAAPRPSQRYVISTQPDEVVRYLVWLKCICIYVYVVLLQKQTRCRGTMRRVFVVTNDKSDLENDSRSLIFVSFDSPYMISY